MAFLQQLLAGRMIKKLFKQLAIEATGLDHYRRLVGERAVAGDLDAMYNATVSRAQRKIRDYVENG